MLISVFREVVDDGSMTIGMGNQPYTSDEQRKHYSFSVDVLSVDLAFLELMHPFKSDDERWAAVLGLEGFKIKPDHDTLEKFLRSYHVLRMMFATLYEKRSWIETTISRETNGYFICDFVILIGTEETRT